MTEKKDTPKTGFELDALSIPAPAQNPEAAQNPAPAPARKKNRRPLPGGADPAKIINLVLKKINKNDSFLTFSNQIGEVNRILNMKYASANDIAQVILKDVPLTSKLLKLVNSSYYGQFSNEGISTITEAMIIIGTDQLKFMAAGLKLIEMMQNIGDSALLKEQILKSIQRSIIAGQIARQGGYVGSEKLQVSAVLFGFGEYLVTSCAPETAKKIRQVQAAYKVPVDRAAKSVTGISFRDLGILVAQKWNMPKTVTRTMKPAKSLRVTKEELGPEDFLPFACAFADELAGLQGKEKGDNKALMRIWRRYRHLFEIEPAALEQILEDAMEQIEKQATALNIHVAKPVAALTDCLKDPDLVETGIADITRTLDTRYSLPAIFEASLNCLWEGFRFSNINFCIRNKQTESMVARYVMGNRKDFFLENFEFKIIMSNDLFNQSLSNEQIVIVKDVQSDTHAALLPMWFKKLDFSKAFAIVPIGRDGKTVSMLYLDWDPEQVVLCPQTASYLETFRQLVVRALKKN